MKKLNFFDLIIILYTIGYILAFLYIARLLSKVELTPDGHVGFAITALALYFISINWFNSLIEFIIRKTRLFKIKIKKLKG